MKIKKVDSKEMCRRGDLGIVIDYRSFYKFKLPDGRAVETKAMSEQEARDYIERCLGTRLQEAA